MTINLAKQGPGAGESSVTIFFLKNTHTHIQIHTHTHTHTKVRVNQVDPGYISTDMTAAISADHARRTALQVCFPPFS